MADLDQDGKIFVGKSVKPEYLTLHYGNRHGLVTGATGTGKTVTLQVLAEGFSQHRRAGVHAPTSRATSPASRSRAATPRMLVERAEELGIDGYRLRRHSRSIFWDLFGEQGHPVRATVSRDGAAAARRACSTSTTRRKACSTSSSRSPTSTACCCST